MFLDSFLNDFGSHVGMILLLLSITFWGKFQIMRSLCQEECEADVNITSAAKPMSKRMRNRCQDKCEADVKANAKPMSRQKRDSKLKTTKA